MTNSETKFRNAMKKSLPDAYIKKMPDYKTGAMGPGGLPDYLIISKGKTIWYEVKKISGDTINLKSHFTEAQKIEFPKMIKAGAEVVVGVYTKTKGLQFILYENIDGRHKF